MKQSISKSAYIFLPICKIIFNDILFFDYQRLSLQAVLFLVPKNVSESCITNDTWQVEQKVSRVLFRSVSTMRAQTHWGEAAAPNADVRPQEI